MVSNVTFYDIHDYYYLPFQQTLTFKILIITGLMIVGAIIGYIFFKRRYRKKISAWQWALQEISKLSPAQCTTKKNLKDFYFNLTDIIKNYLDKRYDWKTLDKTDTELITLLKKKKFDEQLLKNLQKMLSGAEWVKFANQDVIKTQVEADLKTAQKIIEKTTPLEDKRK